jgi:hypothetical protein
MNAASTYSSDVAFSPSVKAVHDYAARRRVKIRGEARMVLM